MTEVELGSYQIGIANDFGPRIVSLRRDDSPQLLAQLDTGQAIDHPGGVYRFHGGHRLWAAPEIAEITYAGDDHLCEVNVENGTASVTAPPDGAGLTKTMKVSCRGDDLMVEHRIEGTPGDDRELAAWAITQFPLGGLALLPMTSDDTGPRPNRTVVLWPYTSLDDPRLRFDTGAALITASDGPPLKLGVGPVAQRLGYLREGWLFTKEAVFTSEGAVPDFGARSQVYVGQGFCELECIGGLVAIGDRPARISEIWTAATCPDEGAALDATLGSGEI